MTLLTISEFFFISFFNAFIVTCFIFVINPVEPHPNTLLLSSYSKRLYSQDDEEEEELETAVRAWPSQSSMSSADDG